MLENASEEELLSSSPAREAGTEKRGSKQKGICLRGSEEEKRGERILGLERVGSAVARLQENRRAEAKTAGECQAESRGGRRR